MYAQEAILKTQLEIMREQRMMIDRDLNEKISTKWVTKTICNRILGENTDSKTREWVGKIKIIRNIMRWKREVGNEGEEEGVGGIFNTRRRNERGAGRRVAGREGSIKRRRLTTRPRRMRKRQSIRSRKMRGIRKTTGKRGGKEKVKILKLSRRIEVRGDYIRKMSMWRIRTKNRRK
jgi:hypothetical protein